jgi:CheY-like chemotaxis protein
VRLEPGDPEAVRARREAEEARVQARRARAADGAAPTRCRILVVEDNPVNVRVAGAFLDRLGHGHEAVPDGTRALSALRRSRSRGHPFDLVLMDLELPGMDGRETTRRIRSGEAGDALRGIPVVAVTAHASAEHRASARAAGMDGFLTKPLDIEEMHQILEDLLGPCLMPGPPPEEARQPPPGRFRSRTGRARSRPWTTPCWTCPGS